MPDNSLPDELISEILAPALKVADEVFSDTSEVSPFAAYSESTSAYLVVCKSWLRVATPLLYNVVILRSKDQAKALARALSQNKELGRFIKKLRLEGGYGPAMHTILQCSPNITDLYLTLLIWSPDTTEGLCKGLSLIRPTKLILRDTMGKGPKNKSVAALVEAIVKVICKWDKLTALDWPYSDGPGPRAATFAAAFAKEKRLATLVVRDWRAAQKLYDKLVPTCQITSVQVNGTWSDFDFGMIHLPNPALKSAMSYIGWQASPVTLLPPPTPAIDIDIAPSLNPFYTPMSAASDEVQASVWSRILSFAMVVPDIPTVKSSMDSPRRLPLLLVSKTFFRLGLPHFYTLIKATKYHHNFDNLLRTALTHRPLVETFHAPYANITHSALCELARCAGSSLCVLNASVVCPDQAVSGEAFADLTALRQLDWSGDISFKNSAPNEPASIRDAHIDSLPRLERLQVTSASQTFFTLLSFMRLPALRTFQSPVYLHGLDYTMFLQAHGYKLTEMDFTFMPDTPRQIQNGILDLCPNLTVLTIYLHDDCPPPFALRSTPDPARSSLVKLTLRVRFRGRRDKEKYASWERFFSAFDTEKLGTPCLEELHFPKFTWPQTERDIAKSYWVKWAEDLLSRTGVNIVDSAGKKWKPRLKVRGRR
ncbi:hypothetical protein C8F01DRAFT_320380 [Mycena amicta]|nr:hypothetical protein C8F01DRAFT_320380 [Mycena amicta]